MDNGYEIKAYFGLYDRNNSMSGGGFSASIERKNLIINKDYSNLLHPTNDTCLILTQFDIMERANQNPECERNSCVQIACIPHTPVPNGAACWTAGWGKTGRSRFSVTDALKEVGVNILERNYCMTHANRRFQTLQADEICAGIPDRDGDGLLDGGADTCGGMFIYIFNRLIICE